MTAVITGIGVVAPTGIGVVEHWESTVGRRSGLGPVSTFDASSLPVRVVGEVPWFDEDEFVPSRLKVQTDRWTWMGLAATRMAFEDARLDPRAHDPAELSVVTASASAGNAFGQREIHALWEEGPQAVSAYQSIGWFYAASSGQISILEQLKGSCGVVVSDSAGGVDAVASAVRLIRRGTNAVVAGGTEAPLSPYALACQSGQATLSTHAHPDRAYRPFSPDACGYVPGEGGAMLVVEDLGFAQRRGARCYAVVAGTASTHDAHHVTDAPPDHRQLARAMRLAIDRAGRVPDVVFADASGDPELDALEAAAITDVLGPRVPVAVPKTMTGRLYAGGAALDLGWAALALHHGVIPPSVNLDGAVIGGLDVVTDARAHSLDSAMVVARGTGGFNSVAVLCRPSDR